MLLFYSYNLAFDSIEKSELRNSTNHSFPESPRSAVNNPIMTITSACSSVSRKRHRASICQPATSSSPKPQHSPPSTSSSTSPRLSEKHHCQPSPFPRNSIENSSQPSGSFTPSPLLKCTRSPVLDTILP